MEDGGAPTDTFLTDPRTCKFDPATLACPAGTDAPNCLNPDQIAAMKVYYAGSTNLATGAVINPGNARGSETSNPGALGFALNESLNEPSFDSLFKWVFGLTWQWQTFERGGGALHPGVMQDEEIDAARGRTRPVIGRGTGADLHGGVSARRPAVAATR